VPQGYQQGTATFDPQRVTVAAAASLVGQASEAVVDVNLDRVTVPVNGVYTPRIVDNRGLDLKDLNLTVTPPAITVQVPIQQQTLYKEVGIRAKPTGQPAPGYALQPLEVNPSTVTLVGDSAALTRVEFVETSVIDLTGVSANKTVPNVALTPPAGTLLLQQGQTVTVTIRVTTLQVNQTVRVPPSVINLSGAVQLARPLDLVAVTISGDAPALSSQALNPSDFKVVLDVSGKGPGRYDNVEAKVLQLPAGMKLEDVSPKLIQVDLIEAPPTPAPVPLPTPSPAPTSSPSARGA
jgi:YbbR domain-containing protein